MNSKVLVWLDLETNGLNPEKDDILEVGVVLTDWNLTEVGRKSWVLHYPYDVYIKANNYVRRMHIENGLWEEVRGSTLSLEDVEVAVMRFLQPYLERGALFVLGGNSVHFDQNFLDKKMPLLATFFHHRNLDISQLALCTERWSPQLYKEISADFFKTKTPHRVLGDLDRCLESARQYRQKIFNCH